MGLLGRGGSKVGKLGALAAARPVLEGEVNLHSTGLAGVCFKPTGAKDAFKAEQKLDDLLEQTGINSSVMVRRRSDSYGFEWLVVRAGDLDERRRRACRRLRPSSRTAASAGSFSRRSSRFNAASHAESISSTASSPGPFWPFVPTGEGQERDNDEEIRLRDGLKSQLPIEPRLERWLRSLRRTDRRLTALQS